MAETRQPVMKKTLMSARSRIPCKVSVGIASRSAIACRWVKDGVEFFWTAAAFTAPISCALSCAFHPFSSVIRDRQFGASDGTPAPLRFQASGGGVLLNSRRRDRRGTLQRLEPLDHFISRFLRFYVSVNTQRLENWSKTSHSPPTMISVSHLGKTSKLVAPPECPPSDKRQAVRRRWVSCSALGVR